MATKQKTGPERLPMIAIIGADGCGKSTVLEYIAQNFAHGRVKDIFIHTRSKYKEGAEQGAIQNYAKKPRSQPTVILKMTIKAILWSANYWLKLVPLSRKRVLILFDHFYFLIAALDPLKYRYSGPDWILWKIVSWVPQPDAYILLDADVSVFYNRKQEASREDVQKLVERHRNFIRNNKAKGYTVDASFPVEHVANEVSKAITQVIEAAGSGLQPR